MAVKLAPHILYTRHDELFIDAVTIEREGKPPREIKIGTFKLAGLSPLALTNQEFQPETIFDPADSKNAGATLFAVKPLSSPTHTRFGFVSARPSPSVTLIHRCWPVRSPTGTEERRGGKRGVEKWRY